MLMWIPVTTADGGDSLQIWRVAVNILNKWSWTADKGWSSSLGFGQGDDKSSPEKKNDLVTRCYPGSQT